jgi:hypothetical protein
MDSRKTYYAYTINNKIIIELLRKKRTQIILSDTQDEISVKIYFFNKKYFKKKIDNCLISK